MSSNLKGSVRSHASQTKNTFLAGTPQLKREDLEGLISFNFKQLDFSQGQNFRDWQKDDLLIPMLDTMRSYSSMKLSSAFGKRFKTYDTFPEKSVFKHPKNVPPDAAWASMHIKGQECIAGHILGDVFFVVFLDKEHEFYPSELKHT